MVYSKGTGNSLGSDRWRLNAVKMVDPAYIKRKEIQNVSRDMVDLVFHMPIHAGKNSLNSQ